MFAIAMGTTLHANSLTMETLDSNTSPAELTTHNPQAQPPLPACPAELLIWESRDEDRFG